MFQHLLKFLLVWPRVLEHVVVLCGDDNGFRSALTRGVLLRYYAECGVCDSKHTPLVSMKWLTRLGNPITTLGIRLNLLNRNFAAKNLQYMKYAYIGGYKTVWPMSAGFISGHFMESCHTTAQVVTD